jgi:hypothetical protein
MVVGEKVEQAITHRHGSYVPARALLTLLGRAPGDEDKPRVWNHVMHYATGAALGALRGVWAITGIRGAPANAWHTVVRPAIDQTVETATGVGAPLPRGRRRRRAVDVLYKADFCAVTGTVADRRLPQC